MASIEEKVEEHFKAIMDSLGIRHFGKTEEINPTIGKALREVDCKDGQIVFKVFKVSDVFNKVEAKCKKENFDKRRDTSTAPNEEYCVPLVKAKVGNNTFLSHI